MEAIINIDLQILLFLQEYIRCDALTAILRAITSLGNGGWFWIALGAALLIPKKTRTAGLLVLLCLGVEALFTNVALKNLIARPRPYVLCPELIPMIPKPHDFSFPSGHTGASFAAALACYRLFPRVWGVGAVVLAGLIGFSRLYLGVHYPTDVLGGILVAVVAVVIVFTIYERKIRCKEE